jgi:CDGSH-type Zn-finger protein/truncated hemoglobin YjbI
MAQTSGVDELAGLRDLLREVTDLARALPDDATRLRDSVIRPLVGLVGDVDPPEPNDQSPQTRLWQATLTATELAARPDAPVALHEATAALQDLACQHTTPDELSTRLADLTTAANGLPPGIRVAENGPYLVTGAQHLDTHLGEPVPTRPLMALCRCGESTIKPWCDGSHARIGFTDSKDPDRVPDRRDTYVGQQVTVFDNRGICAHSGRCTDRLASVFHAGGEPFVTPSGGRMDEIIRAVRDCPSGALSFAVGGREAREEIDGTRRDQAILVSKDGPYRITGGIPLVDDNRRDIPRATGASREHYSLCRCGHSQNKPFCSGMHYYVNFADPVADPDEVPTLFEWAGGYPALLRMTRLFYERYVPADPLLAPVFASMSADHPERVARWLSEVFGGPAFYTEQHGGYSRMISQHIGKGLTEAQRSRWVALLSESAEAAGLPADAEFRAAFVAYLEWGSRIALENSQAGAQPPPNMPVPRWWWVCDANPRARISALATKPEPEPEVTLPADDEPIGFAAHIKPLFRSMDRNSMRFAFDLWSHTDVSTHATAILERLQAGSMPCDGAWPPARIAVLARWIDTGKAE